MKILIQNFMARYNKHKMTPRTNVYSEDTGEVLKEIERLTRSCKFKIFLENTHFYIFQFIILDKKVGIILN